MTDTNASPDLITWIEDTSSEVISDDTDAVRVFEGKTAGKPSANIIELRNGTFMMFTPRIDGEFASLDEAKAAAHEDVLSSQKKRRKA